MIWITDPAICQVVAARGGGGKGLVRGWGEGVLTGGSNI